MNVFDPAQLTADWVSLGGALDPTSMATDWAAMLAGGRFVVAHATVGQRPSRRRNDGSVMAPRSRSWCGLPATHLSARALRVFASLIALPHPEATTWYGSSRWRISTPTAACLINGSTPAAGARRVQFIGQFGCRYCASC